MTPTPSTPATPDAEAVKLARRIVKRPEFHTLDERVLAREVLHLNEGWNTALTVAAKYLERAEKAEAEILRLSEAAPAGNAWRPIETAPQKQRVPLMIGYWHKARWVCRVAVLDAVADGDEPFMRWLALPNYQHITPTHWMPLPAPPSPTPETRQS